MHGDDIQTRILQMIDAYVLGIHEELQARWGALPRDLTRSTEFEVVGGLMARQVSLASQMAKNPGIWNAHLAPLVLRAMVDAFITFAWILMEPVERSERYIMHGLGQEKLMIEHQKNRLSQRGGDPDLEAMIRDMEDALSEQRFPFLTEVNVGSWSGVDTRKMAQEAGQENIYQFAYTPFSAATHSMWNHLYKHNLKICANPLHRMHRLPSNPDYLSDPDYLYRAARYVDKTFRQFDAIYQADVTAPSALVILATELQSILSDQQEVEDK